MKRHASQQNIPAHTLAPGYFTQLMREHNWPPGFVSRVDAMQEQRLIGVAATLHNERFAADAAGCGRGLLPVAEITAALRPAHLLRAARR